MIIAIISDIHEDIVSLKKALKIIEENNCCKIVCLGDILGYPYLNGKYENSKNVNECINIIKSNCIDVVLGNHDIYHLLNSKHKIEFTYNNLFYTKSKNLYKDSELELTENNFEYLISLPEFKFITLSEKTYLFSHYLYPNINGLNEIEISNSSIHKIHFDFMNSNNCNISICGHLHIDGIGVCYKPFSNILSRFLNGFNYSQNCEVSMKNLPCCVTIPAIANFGGFSGFVLFDTESLVLQVISLSYKRQILL
ncbi:MAG: hypothetical protein A2033_03765 [Bacteroidetes bacterium GWA2_31_9]|nr:MAG: hypothetical protein A2033_03765 [Bacteroidetes bacterium GWA2_31_9]